ncbi:hypothetical protein Q9966_008610 [Columba livia]|nr:hypothetical protein Q9966_008610 [Columba livia]
MDLSRGFDYSHGTDHTLCWMSSAATKLTDFNMRVVRKKSHLVGSISITQNQEYTTACAPRPYCSGKSGFHYSSEKKYSSGIGWPSFSESYSTCGRDENNTSTMK